jgi:RNA recognition motif-containing protein
MENGKPTRKAFVHFANPAIAATFREKLMNKELMGVRLWIRYAVDKMNSRRLRTSAGSRTSDESRIVFDA